MHFFFASPSSAQNNAGGRRLLIISYIVCFLFDFLTALLDCVELVLCARLLGSLLSKGNIHQLLTDAQLMHLALQHE